MIDLDEYVVWYRVLVKCDVSQRNNIYIIYMYMHSVIVVQLTGDCMCMI